MIKFVYGILPTFVSYTDDMSSERGGYARGPLIRIRPRYKDDPGIIAHELQHVRQWYRSAIIFHGIRKRFSERYRLWIEIEAYAIQYNCYKDKTGLLDLFSGYIADYYDLDISKAEARALLKKEI